MSDHLSDSSPIVCGSAVHDACQIQTIPAREAELGGGLKIRRALPTKGRRLVGAWCFLDHFGPLDFGKRKAMDVASHPHIGLQTVTWMLQGEVHHKDSLGYDQIIRAGQCNIMTAGEGITHSEETPVENSGRVHGVQLWIALPDASRHVKPAFDHHPELPFKEIDGLRVQVFVGETLGMTSPARTYSPLLGIDVMATGDGEAFLPLRTDFEHALIVVEGSFEADGVTMTSGNLYDLGLGRDGVKLKADRGARLVLVGGAPLGEDIIMWWNFVARTHEEIAEARRLWEAEEHFGPVTAYKGGRLKSPELVARLS